MKVRSKKELLRITEELFRDKQITFEVNPQHQNTPQAYADQYYSSMEPRPYSSRDMQPKPFHKDFSQYNNEAVSAQKCSNYVFRKH